MSLIVLYLLLKEAYTFVAGELTVNNCPHVTGSLLILYNHDIKYSGGGVNIFRCYTVLLSQSANMIGDYISL